MTGALVEGEIAAKTILADLTEDAGEKKAVSQQRAEQLLKEETAVYEAYFSGEEAFYTTEQLEEAMQKVMDEYAGGISVNYQFNEKQLDLAEEKIEKLAKLAEKAAAGNMHELLFAYELKERLTVCQVLIAHLRARKETRWHSFNENLDYPDTDETFEKYVNSRMEDGKVKIILRDIVKEAEYEHQNE